MVKQSHKTEKVKWTKINCYKYKIVVTKCIKNIQVVEETRAWVCGVCPDHTGESEKIFVGRRSVRRRGVNEGEKGWRSGDYD